MIDYRKLEAFCKVYELQSFSRAGKDLFLSQPTISAHVSALEAELNVPLLDRMGRVVLPTEAGVILYKHAKEAFASLASARAEIAQLHDEISGEIVIGGSTIPAHYLLPGIMASYMRLHTGVDVSLKVADSEAVINKLSSGELTVGVVGAFENDPELTFVPIVDDELVVIASPEYAGERKELPFEELSKYDWVMREQGSGTRKAFANALAERNVDIRSLPSVVQVESTNAVIQFVKAGMGLSITSRLAVASEVERGDLCILPVSDMKLHRKFYCAYHNRRHYFPATQSFIQYLKENTRTMRDDAGFEHE
ncbi:selenium metabolism-associated LysR family transcriptional regulator [Halodesulfovibrio spirochaetisodalis]|uniref:LysR family transcriptional regulator n=1 Tax=Halodesulfovibrio spirochaetisodalis TaxID=1560234 RepID=A0A1B7XQ08_9BACT|nr:selenium metabolism-associated LysR family transcriptional regulator [Halodesulfovibrio spirochaetisodalis]OBQ57597.1 LysR family transcriptional regulator [Halodesulfovibrio spirochaetisodalis]